MFKHHLTGLQTSFSVPKKTGHAQSSLSQSHFGNRNQAGAIGDPAATGCISIQRLQHLTASQNIKTNMFTNHILSILSIHD